MQRVALARASRSEVFDGEALQLSAMLADDMGNDVGTSGTLLQLSVCRLGRSMPRPVGDIPRQDLYHVALTEVGGLEPLPLEEGHWYVEAPPEAEGMASEQPTMSGRFPLLPKAFSSEHHGKASLRFHAELHHMGTQVLVTVSAASNSDGKDSSGGAVEMGLVFAADVVYDETRFYPLPYVCPPPPGIWLLSATPSSNIDLRFLGVSFGAYGDGALDAYTNSTANIEAEQTELQKAPAPVAAKAAAQPMVPAAPPASAEAVDKDAAEACLHQPPLRIVDQTPKGCLGLYTELGAEDGDALKSEIADMTGSPRPRREEAGMDIEEDGR
eukprot:jgi/Tetstr1/438532/TSEL_027084.t1